MSDRFQKIADLEINQVPDGYVIYQADRDRVHFLNSTAAAVLELLRQRPFTRGDRGDPAGRLRPRRFARSRAEELGGKPPRRGPHIALHRVVVHTLSRELRLHTDSDEAFAALSYLGAEPAMPEGEYAPVDLMVERFGEFYRIRAAWRPSGGGGLA